MMTKNIISRDEARALCPAYVKFALRFERQATLKAYGEAIALEGGGDGWELISKPFMWDWDAKPGQGPTCGIKKGMKGITYYDGQFVRIKVTCVKNPMHESDGPMVRVTNGEYSWRVDGDKYAWFTPTGVEEAKAVVDAVLDQPSKPTPAAFAVPANDLAVRVQALAKEGRELSSYIRDMAVYRQKSAEFDAKLDALDRENEGLAPGRRLLFGVADGNAVYVVLKVRKADVIVAHIPVGDAWQWQGIYQDGAGNLVCPRPVAERQCRGKRLADIFAGV